MKKISFVVPVHNEGGGILFFLEKLLMPEILKLKKYSYEVILIDDGSTDNSLEIILRYAEKNNNLKVVALSKNFGKEPALAAGLKIASGDSVFMLDADGQQPPSLIHDFIAKWEEGFDTIIGVRDKFTKHGFIQKIGSKLFYKMMRLMNGDSMVAGSTDFRLLDRSVVDVYNELSEHNRITRGLIDWLGFKKAYIKYVYGERQSGRPSYNLKKLIGLAVDSFVSLSTTPLVIFGYIGLLITIFSGGLGIFIIVNQYLLGDPLKLYWNGAVQLSVFITFLVGLVLISQAITALYISQIHTEAKNRPLYIIDKKRSKNL